MKKLKWYGILFALFMLFLYIMGVYDIFMMLSHNAQYYMQHDYDETVIVYFTSYPLYMLMFWIVNLVCGVLSPVLYFIKNKYSYVAAFASGTADFILILLGLLFRKRFETLGVSVFFFDLCILIITFLFGIFTYKQEKVLKRED